MQCPTCSSEIAENQRFCGKCGMQILARATSQVEAMVCQCLAGTAAPDVDGICKNCGFRVASPAQVYLPIKFDFPPDLGLVSDRGRHHPINQDAGIAGRSPTGAVAIVVADGVSAADKADVASATAVAAAYKELVEAADDEAGEEVVHRAVRVAHAAVMAIPHTGTHLEEPETTIVLALLRGRSAHIAWVGDSRVYTISRACSRLITRDDSWLADAVESGHMSLDEALADSRSHSITQCLGMLNDDIRVHVRNIVLEPDTWLLVCTDGLWNYYDQLPAMAGAVGDADADADADAFELCQHLVRLANQAGGHDNITVAAYRLKSVADGH